MVDIPEFLISPFFVDEPGNWHLLPGAPEEIVKEFNEYREDMKDDLKADEEGESEGNARS